MTYSHTADACQARRRAGAGRCCGACEHEPMTDAGNGVTVRRVATEETS